MSEYGSSYIRCKHEPVERTVQSRQDGDASNAGLCPQQDTDYGTQYPIHPNCSHWDPLAGGESAVGARQTGETVVGSWDLCHRAERADRRCEVVYARARDDLIGLFYPYVNALVTRVYSQ